MIASPQRQELVAEIEQACRDGVPLGSACAELGLSARTVARWPRTGEVRADAIPKVVSTGTGAQAERTGTPARDRRLSRGALC